MGLAVLQSKVNKQVRLVESLFYFRAGQGGGPLSKGPLSAPVKRGVRACTDRVAGAGGVLQAETAQSSSPVIFTSVVSGLTSIILIVLGPVNFQFRGVPVPTSLWSILRTVAAQVLGMVIM